MNTTDAAAHNISNRALWAALFLLIAAASVMNLWRLGDAPLSNTEGLRAITAHQIAESGNWIVPKLYGQTYLRKPPGHAWVLAVFERVTGHANEFLWRLPSALAAIAMACFMLLMTRRWFGNFAGIVAGFSMLALVPLWGQNRAAEIDGLNTFFAVLAACGLIEIGFGQGRRWAWAILVAVGIGGLLMVKGPADLPLILGVIFGSSIAAKHWRWLRQPSVWLSILVGVGLFATWAIAAWLRVDKQVDTQSTNGIREILARLTPSSFGWLLRGLTMPLALLAVAFPLNISLLVLLRRNVLTGLTPAQQKLARALLGSIIATFVLLAVFTIQRPRYGYMVLPMFCPLVGLVAHMWRSNLLTQTTQLRLRQIGTLSALMYGGMGLVFAWIAATSGSLPWTPIAIACVVLPLAATASFCAWYKCELRRAVWIMLVTIVTAGLMFNSQMNRKRAHRSGDAEGLSLSKLTQPNDILIANNVVQDHPEVFWYANRPVRRYQGGITEALNSGAVGWFVVDPQEFKQIKNDPALTLSNVQRLPGVIIASLVRIENASTRIEPATSAPASIPAETTP